MSEGIRAEPGEAAAYWDLGTLPGWPAHLGRPSEAEPAGSSNVWAYLGQEGSGQAGGLSQPLLHAVTLWLSERKILKESCPHTHITTELQIFWDTQTESSLACWPKHGILSFSLRILSWRAQSCRREWLSWRVCWRRPRQPAERRRFNWKAWDRGKQNSPPLDIGKYPCGVEERSGELYSGPGYPTHYLCDFGQITSLLWASFSLDCK